MANRNSQNSRVVCMQFLSQKADTTNFSKFHSSFFLSNEYTHVKDRQKQKKGMKTPASLQIVL